MLDYSSSMSYLDNRYQNRRRVDYCTTISTTKQSVPKAINRSASMSSVGSTTSKHTFNRILNSLARRQLFLDFEFNAAASTYEPIRSIGAGAFGIVCEAHVIKHDNEDDSELKKNTSKNRVNNF